MSKFNQTNAGEQRQADRAPARVPHCSRPWQSKECSILVFCFFFFKNTFKHCKDTFSLILTKTRQEQAGGKDLFPGSPGRQEPHITTERRRCHALVQAEKGEEKERKKKKKDEGGSTFRGRTQSWQLNSSALSSVEWEQDGKFVAWHWKEAPWKHDA